MTLSASSLERAEKCVASVVLPQVKSTSEAADRGTICHRYLEMKARGEPIDMATIPLEHRQWLVDIDVAALLKDMGPL